jgi:xylan 1,4-beta-xylosidase
MTFSNPVIPGFYPDPSVCRVGDDYYLVASSFTFFPGVPIFHSKNLVDWVQIGNVLDRPAQLDLSGTLGWDSWGVFAPTIRHHAGRFWMITTIVGDKGAQSFIVTAEDPSGPWSDPINLSIPGIDPDLCWDGENNCWVHFSGLAGIARGRIDDTTGEFLDEPVPTWSGSGLAHPEAPHLLERDGTWYLLIAEGGTESGHAVSIARGPSPTGTWQGNPANPILSHRSSGKSIQNTGHGDLVEAPDGSWWMVHLGVRKQGVTPRFHVLGRETFLAPVTWVDGWPVVGHVESDMEVRPPGSGDPVNLQTRDEFAQGPLHPRWLAYRRPTEAFSSFDRQPGWLTLAGTDATMDSSEPAFVGRRQQHHRCRFRASVEAGTSAEAGIAIRSDCDTHYGVAIKGDRVVAHARIGPLSQEVGEAAKPRGDAVLVIETHPNSRGPDFVRLGVEDATGTLQVLAELDGRYLSTEVTGGFIGRVVGMYAVGGEAAFAWAEYEGFD